MSTTHLKTLMKNSGFTPIKLQVYVELHLHADPDTNRAEIQRQLESAIEAYRAGARCQCGAPIWIIGSAQAGLACFTCITGQPSPDYDYEIDIADKDTFR
jgi:hypothetical protein